MWEWLEIFIRLVPGPLVVMVLAMSPVWEVRMSIAVGILLYDMHWAPVFLLSFAGNLLIVPVLHQFYPWLERLLRRSERLERGVDRFLARTRKRREAKIRHLEEAALVGLIGIPVPGTGTWTGALVAHIFGLRLQTALPYYIIGILIACTITTALVEAGRWGVAQF